MILIINEIDKDHTEIPTVYSYIELVKSDNYISDRNLHLFDDYICNVLDCSYIDILFCDAGINSIIDLIKNQFDDQIIELVVNIDDKTIKFNSYNSNFDLSELEYKTNKFLNSKHIDLFPTTSDDIHYIYRYIKMELLLVVDSIKMKSANSLKIN